MVILHLSIVVSCIFVVVVVLSISVEILYVFLAISGDFWLLAVSLLGIFWSLCCLFFIFLCLYSVVFFSLYAEIVKVEIPNIYRESCQGPRACTQ